VTIARAPGKLVLSGAYAVLDGAPALVGAVDRYVTADSSRPASWIAREVEAAVRAGLCARPVDYDASALRSGDGARKLGLGSSAAILVASALAAPGAAAPPVLSRAWIEAAVSAHREAQGGGSGIDVVASAEGGVVYATRGSSSELSWRAWRVPDGLRFTVWSLGSEASTKDLVARVRAWKAADPAAYEAVVGPLAEQARVAAEAGAAEDVRAALEAQGRLLAALGDGAGTPIFPAALIPLREALAGRVAVLPSGAGGGDVVLAVTVGALAAADRASLAAAGLEAVACEVGAPGAAIVSA